MKALKHGAEWAALRSDHVVLPDDFQNYSFTTWQVAFGPAQALFIPDNAEID